MVKKMVNSLRSKLLHQGYILLFVLLEMKEIMQKWMVTGVYKTFSILMISLWETLRKVENGGLLFHSQY